LWWAWIGWIFKIRAGLGGGIREMAEPTLGYRHLGKIMDGWRALWEKKSGRIHAELHIHDDGIPWKLQIDRSVRLPRCIEMYGLLGRISLERCYLCELSLIDAGLGLGTLQGNGAHTL